MLSLLTSIRQLSYEIVKKWFLLQVKQDGFFPADLLFLASTNADGVCYTEVYLFIYIFQYGISVLLTFFSSVCSLLMLGMGDRLLIWTGRPIWRLEKHWKRLGITWLRRRHLSLKVYFFYWLAHNSAVTNLIKFAMNDLIIFHLLFKF